MLPKCKQVSKKEKEIEIELELETETECECNSSECEGSASGVCGCDTQRDFEIFICHSESSDRYPMRNPAGQRTANGRPYIVLRRGEHRSSVTG